MPNMVLPLHTMISEWCPFQSEMLPDDNDEIGIKIYKEQLELIILMPSSVSVLLLI